MQNNGPSKEDTVVNCANCGAKPMQNINGLCDECDNCRKHLQHPFYYRANEYREEQRRGQILKGAAKYPEPFKPENWSPKELLAHAMQENIDQGHYIYGLYEKIEEQVKKIDSIREILQTDKAAEVIVNEIYKILDFGGDGNE